MIAINKQTDVRAKKTKRKSDWRTLVDEMERQGGYVDRAIINDLQRDRRERVKSSSATLPPGTEGPQVSPNRGPG